MTDSARIALVEERLVPMAARLPADDLACVAQEQMLARPLVTGAPHWGQACWGSRGWSSAPPPSAGCCSKGRSIATIYLIASRYHHHHLALGHFS